MTETASAMHAGKASLHAALKSVSEYLLPFAGAIAGFFISGGLGGRNSVFRALVDAQVSNGTAARLAAAVVAGLNAVIGGVFWSIRNGGGMILKLLGGTAGGFFFGAAAANAIGIIIPYPAQDGLIEKLAGDLSNVAGGN